MIGEAFDTAVTLGLALLAWIAIGAAAVTAAGFAVTVMVVGAVRAVWEAVAGAMSASRALRALGSHPDRYAPPQRPSWATRASDSTATRASPELSPVHSRAAKPSTNSL